MSAPAGAWDARFAVLFDDHFARLFRFLDRLSGDADLAADLTQEAFIRLYRRGAMPDAPEAWLISVAMNLFRNARAKAARRRRLLTITRAQRVHSDESSSPLGQVTAEELRLRVRAALDGLPERERLLLLLSAEDYSYRDIARALKLKESSVGTMLARARHQFRLTCTETRHVR